MHRAASLAVSVMRGVLEYMAQVAEISMNKDGSVRVHRVTVAADVGMMVNPDTVEAQIQSGIITPILVINTFCTSSKFNLPEQVIN